MSTELAPVDWPTRNAGDFTKAIQDFYVRKPKKAAVRVTPRLLLPLLEFLDEVAAQARADMPEGPAKLGIKATLDGWDKRSGEYRASLVAAFKQAPDEGALISTSVTGPLILGWYPGEDSQRTLDAVTPIQAAHMVEAATDAMESAWEKLGEDLTEAAKEATSGATEAAQSTFKAGEWLLDEQHPWRLPLVGLGTLAVVGGAVFGAVRLGQPTVVVRGGK